MKLLVGKGFYREIATEIIWDPNHTFVQDICLDFLMEMEDGHTNAIIDYKNAITRIVCPDMTLKVEEVGMEENKPGYGEPGFLYLRGSLKELQRYPHGYSIFIQLVCPDDSLLAMTVHPKSVGYSFDTSNFNNVGYGLSAQQLSIIEMDWLVSTPGPRGPADIDIPDYLKQRTHTLHHIVYPKEVVEQWVSTTM